jgi:hypothetical protein
MPGRALTIAVVVMGAMIVAGLGLIAAKIAGGGAHRTARPAASQPFIAAPIELPNGAHIAAISTGTDRVVVDLALPDGSQELLIIDLSTGRRLGTVPLHPAPSH